ncbi:MULTISPECIES: alanyl-tRNA editing protein [Agrobacterium]|jgi:misacylated tRNA(Ala) deacylase|uniref:alanyl-tRNA editing protein n=1 Tax=Agrobacterium TaxID=357 RepID=UPI00088978BA|nr:MULTISPECIES: alanyl-tRNA editing protein [Agrobacterium]MBB2904743.1 misacylated tRNA(Ala) deacylase [Rhizobium sp. RAS22]TGR67100.1 alanyl-tRNA editing protein [bacterium M00.F.Ca.ET.194.01.1.1]TGS53647.1 alanyl-tRNA editing protein [bacterium M00.F.Ca.ET.179.01.1.1]TGV46407.1 alanyl-tRNA editing protein [bacterium M00.F.Ca.ET.168.01.1.1]MBN8930921.1 alanyl-tRNA editing protein [Agrobacterium pusense]
MPVNALFRDDFYLSTAEAIVTAVHEDGGIEFDQTCFYATSGGQPGDTGFLERADGSRIALGITKHGADKSVIIHVPLEDQPSPEVGEKLTLHVDWPRRYKLMRMHTACHLLSVVCQWPITGAAVGEDESRVDFDMSETIDKDDVTARLMELVRANHPVFLQWITDEELQANPGIVKSKNVRPPMGLGRVSLVCIGENSSIDSQPCGGTHVSETQEVGDIHIAKIEKKGKENRRFRIRFGAPEAVA